MGVLIEDKFSMIKLKKKIEKKVKKKWLFGKSY